MVGYVSYVYYVYYVYYGYVYYVSILKELYFYLSAPSPQPTLVHGAHLCLHLPLQV